MLSIGRRFEWLAASIEGNPDCGVPIAASRSGYCGCLNLSLISDVTKAKQATEKFLKLARGTKAVVLEFPFTAASEAVLEVLEKAPIDKLILVQMDSIDIEPIVQRGRTCCKLLGKVVFDADEAKRSTCDGFDFVVGKGNEAGGFVSDSSSFVLLQSLVQATHLPVYIWGGVGPATVAACCVAGAAGAVLDWQLALVRESNLPLNLKTRLASRDAIDTRVVEVANRAIRIFSSRMDQRAYDALGKIAHGSQQVGAAPQWLDEVRSLLAKNRATSPLWLMSQDAEFLESLAPKANSVSKLIGVFKQSLVECLASVKGSQFLSSDSPLARFLGTRYPILQGPMTRVSDVPAFAKAVAEGGALPFLAVAMMRRPELLQMLLSAQTLMEDIPWGIGLLGFLDRDLRNEQLAVLEEVRPKFAVLSGGRPDQAAALDSKGIATFLHVASPSTLRAFIVDGARRFIFEGRECGGHVGPRTSFVLWQSAIDVVVELNLPAAELSKLQIVFAGGIHDELSGAMVAALAQPLERLGVQVGVLLGTGYLFTDEIVATGAILPQFQEVALRASDTKLVETGLGHVIRCAPTNFVEHFRSETARLQGEGKSKDEISQSLESLTVGRLRIASKGVKRGELSGGATASGLVMVPDEEQLANGMYMVGQLASLRSQRCTIAELHSQVIEAARQRLEAVVDSDTAGSPEEEIVPETLDVAVVGMSCMLPGARNLEEYWYNIVNNRDSIIEIPEHRFAIKEWFDADPKARDKTYSRWGGFVTEVSFDPLKFGIPPTSLPSIEPGQLLTLEVVDQALRDAGYAQSNPHRLRTSVIIGNSGGLADLGSKYIVRAWLPHIIRGAGEELLEQLPEWTEDSFPGVLTNVLAGRVANRFNVGGTNYTVDAACGSSLAAIHLACRELADKTSDMVIVGGVDLDQNPFAFLAFSKTGALSPRGRSHAFDKDADGIAISEGLACVVVKRLEDAERDGDRIYAVIRATAGGSDGRSLGLTAPLVDGQLRTLKRAYAQAKFSPGTCGIFEAHGTGTAVGDVAECQSLTMLLEQAQCPSQSVAIGSVKSQIGHTKSTAGIAGLIKMSLALNQGVLPPTLHVKQPNPKARLLDGPLYVNSETRPWIKTSVPRRGGVSAFGFGGTNFHAVLEEYMDDAASTPSSMLSNWPAELFVFRGSNRKDLGGKIRAFANQVQSARSAGQELSLAQVAYLNYRTPAASTSACRATVVSQSVDELLEQLELAAVELDQLPSLNLPSAGKGGSSQVSTRAGICINDEPPVNANSIVFLYPGQGSQAVNMLRDLAILFPEVRDAFGQADHVLEGKLPKTLSRYIFPPPAFDSSVERKQAEELKDTRIAQPALGVCGVALTQLLSAFSVEPGMVAGHSYGELPALWAAGAVSTDDLHWLSHSRGLAALAGGEKTDQEVDLGAMMAVQASRIELAGILADIEGVWFANTNSPVQTVISGTKAGLAVAAKQLQLNKVNFTRLNVSAAFHSPLMETGRLQFAKVLLDASVSVPVKPLFSNNTAAIFPSDIVDLKCQLSDQFVREVRFVDQISNMYSTGGRIFIEIGPGKVLQRLVSQILSSKPHVSLALQSHEKPGLVSFLTVIGELIARGLPVNIERLYATRNLGDIRLRTESTPPPVKKHTWIIDGGDVRPVLTPQLVPKAKVDWSDLVKARTTSAPLAAFTSSVETRTAEMQEFTASFADPTATTSATSVDAETRQPDFSHQMLPNQELASPRNEPEPSISQHDKALRMTISDQPSSGIAEDMYGQFQETMRQFLVTQQRVTELLFAGGSSSGNGHTHPSVEAHYSAESQSASLSPRNQVDQSPTVAHTLRSETRTSVPSPGQLHNHLSASQQPQFVSNPAPNVASFSVTQDLVKPQIAVTIPAVIEAAIPKLKQLTTPVADLAAILVGLVSARTGYPTESLQLDADLSADLGIDSIKKLEIVSAFRLAIASDLTETPSWFMDKVTATRNLQGVIDAGRELLKASGGAMESDSEPRGNVSETAAVHPKLEYLDDVALSLILVRLASEKTGYPPESFSTELNLESELGIDSIKRIEILSAFRREVVPESVTDATPFMEEVGSAKTFAAVIEGYRRWLKPISSSDSAYLPTPPSPQVVSSSESFTSPGITTSAVIDRAASVDDAVADAQSTAVVQAARCVARIVEAPFRQVKNWSVPKGTIVLIDDGQGLAKSLAHYISSLGGSVASVEVSQLASAEAAQALFQRLREVQGPLAGIFHLAALRSSSVFPGIEESEVITRVGEELKSLLYVLQAAAPEFKAAKQTAFFLATLSRGGGDFHIDNVDEASHPWRGGIAGMLKTAVAEWPHAFFTAIDVDEPPPVEELLQQVCSAGPIEIGYRRGKRYRIATVRQEIQILPGATPFVDLNSESVVLVTGGANGITAEVALEIARATKAKFVLLGRTLLPPGPEDPVTVGIEDTNELRKRLLIHLKSTGANVSLKSVEKAVQATLKIRAIRDNLAEFKKLGASVEYLPCDVGDSAQLTNVLREIRHKYGHVDALIHGAGVIEDQLITDKSSESFDRVYWTKVSSMLVLARELEPEPLKLVMLFGSVSGFFGNSGQVDYAAANETLNRIARRLQTLWKGKCVVMNWGPWRDVGMVSPGVAQKLEAEGMELIAVPAGRAAARLELMVDDQQGVRVLIGNGQWLSHEYTASTHDKQRKVKDRALTASS